MQAGDKIFSGDYEWHVLDVQDNTTLIITEYVIKERPYHDICRDITWEERFPRMYLNGEFYNKSSGRDRSRAISMLNQNMDNQWYGTKGGASTWDRIFLLSLEEAAYNYFGDSSSKLYHPGKDQRRWFERKGINNSRRTAHHLENERGWWWWLCSSGCVGIKAAYIWGTDGNIGIQGNNILKGNLDGGRCRGGICPALRLML